MYLSLEERLHGPVVPQAQRIAPGLDARRGGLERVRVGLALVLRVNKFLVVGPTGIRGKEGQLYVQVLGTSIDRFYQVPHLPNNTHLKPRRPRLECRHRLPFPPRHPLLQLPPRHRQPFPTPLKRLHHPRIPVHHPVPNPGQKRLQRRLVPRRRGFPRRGGPLRHLFGGVAVGAPEPHQQLAEQRQSVGFGLVVVVVLFFKKGE